MTTRTMGDAVVPDNIPTTVQVAAVYRNGLWAADPAKVAARS